MHHSMQAAAIKILVWWLLEKRCRVNNTFSPLNHPQISFCYRTKNLPSSKFSIKYNYWVLHRQVPRGMSMNSMKSVLQWKLFIYLFICFLFVYLCPSVHRSNCLSVWLCLLACLSLPVSICLSVCSFVRQSVHIFIYLFI